MKSFIYKKLFLISTIMGVLFFTGCSSPNGPEKTIPGDEQDKYGIPSNKVLGNGNYTMHSFIGEESFRINKDVAESVNYYLGKGETYVKGFVNQFSDSLKGRPTAEAYFAQFISEEQNNEFKRLNENGSNPYSFDTTINGIVQPCLPIYENILRLIDNNKDRAIFIRLFQALSNQSYKYGLGNCAKDEYSQMDVYHNTRDAINKAWNGSTINNYFDINNDIDNQNCLNVTQEMDRILAPVADKLGITLQDLHNFIIISMTPYSLTSMHHLSKSALKHTSCSVSLNIVSEMEKIGNQIYWEEQNNSLIITK